MGDDDYEAAVRAGLAAHARGVDMGEWLALLGATIAARLGSTETFLANRPGSWEADLAEQLVRGTVGYGDEDLARHALEA